MNENNFSMHYTHQEHNKLSNCIYEMFFIKKLTITRQSKYDVEAASFMVITMVMTILLPAIGFFFFPGQTYT